MNSESTSPHQEHNYGTKKLLDLYNIDHAVEQSDGSMTHSKFAQSSLNEPGLPEE